VRAVLLGALAIVAVTARLGWAADAPQQAPPSPATSSSPTSANPPATSVPDENPDTVPWNPDVCHSNAWPYKEPLRIPTDYCGPPGEFWIRTEYSFWSFRGDRLPALVTSGPAGSGTVLGQPGVGTLFGGSTVNGDAVSGGRFTGGVWFNSCYTFGFEGSYFFLGDRVTRFGIGSLGSPGSTDLGRPFVNILTGQPESLVVAVPGVAGGAVTVSDKTEPQGAEANLVGNLCRTATLTINLMGGFRYLDLREEVTVADSTLGVAGSPTPGTSTITVDDFTTHNHFYGGQLGVQAEYRWHCLAFTLVEKLALGVNTGEATISGGSLIGTATTVTTLPSLGLLVQPSNAGSHWHDSFGVVNEIGGRVGWQINDYVQVFAGYTFVYASSVVRPGGVIDPGLNLAQGAGGPARPGALLRETDFWAQGLNAGVEVRY
jgi:hypothetical protein